MGARDTGPSPQEGPQASYRPAPDEAPEPLTSERYPPRLRLARGVELSRCWETGRRIRMHHFDIAWRPNVQGHARMGIVVPRFGHSAVARNRLRRRMREVVRRDVLRNLPAVDLVVRAKPGAYAVSFAALRAELTDGAARVCQ